MNKIINRYIFREIALPFVIILFVLTFVLLMGKILQIMDLMINKGIRVLDIAHLIALIMPNFLLFTIPIALLVSILIAMGRLSADNEITVLKASGVSLLQLFYPAAVASLLAFACAMVIGYFLVPQSNFATKRLLFELASQNAGIGIKEKVFNADFKGLLLYADTIPADGASMENVIISDSRVLGEQNTILAKKAFLVADPKLMIVKLRLENGSIHTVGKDLKNYRKVDFKSYDINLDLSSTMSSFTDEAKSSTEMTLSELLERMKKPDLAQAAMRELAIEVHKKFSIPLSCIFFGLLAMPLGITHHRSVKSRGFAVGLIIVAVYYLLRIGGEALVENGRMDPALGVWAPNMLFALLGVFLFYLAHREISVSQALIALFQGGKPRG
ncbi:MAG: LPS export ABC transporter permease LptF [Smithellaceae bacterium]|jgi:lipopolysaccharide export system permease protein|nr:LPS export ABC transporter permease LptF [Smithellaceae bacterium]MDD3848853.1 LPS export ABC transporter permease LptF [Smithellaceae bacterium]HOQ71211.1 LPS export ABC transporter permease LptF [Smithellaceae bacterium]HPL09208.1 LPS export ABC transporter permease LptF [Smithellaceae bacterium]